MSVKLSQLNASTSNIARNINDIKYPTIRETYAAVPIQNYIKTLVLKKCLDQNFNDLENYNFRTMGDCL